MTIRAQENQGLQYAIINSRPLCTMEKVMLCHAEIKPVDKVLDVHACSGQLSEYLLKNTSCQLCGVSDRMEEVRLVRSRYCGGDIAYAAIGDIPWPDSTFDVALLHPSEGGIEALEEQLRECRRVLRPDGRLVLGLKHLPMALRYINYILGNATEDDLPAVPEAKQIMKKIGFERITAVQASLSSYVLMGWRTNETR